MNLIEMMALAPTGPFEPVFNSTTLAASDGGAQPTSIAASADGTTVASANQNDSLIASNAGAVYVFVRSAAGGWSQQAKLTSAVANQKLGIALALSDDGNTLVVGTNDGANIYVYTRTGTTWSAPTTITPSSSGGSWGSAVSINGAGTRIAVGAPGQTFNGNAGAGVFYVYDLISGTWTETVTALGRTGAGASEGVGADVKISGDGTRIVAMPSQSGTRRGVVFALTAGVWAQEAVLTDTQSTTSNAVSINADGSTVAVAVGGAGSNASSAVYKRNGINWALSCNIASPASITGTSGWTNWYWSDVSISGDGSVIALLFNFFFSSNYNNAALIFTHRGGGVYALCGKATTPYIPYYTSGYLGGVAPFSISCVALCRDGKSVFAGNSAGLKTAQSGDRV